MLSNRDFVHCFAIQICHSCKWPQTHAAVLLKATFSGDQIYAQCEKFAYLKEDEIGVSQLL